MFMIWSRILKMTLIQQQSLHVRRTLSGSGLGGDLGERGNRDSQLSDTLTTHAANLRLRIPYAFTKDEGLKAIVVRIRDGSGPVPIATVRLLLTCESPRKVTVLLSAA
jgi:hypothetical protein